MGRSAQPPGGGGAPGVAGSLERATETSVTMYNEIHRGLEQWLFPGGKSPPPQCSEERHSPTPLPSSYEPGVESGGSRSDRRPWFVVEQVRCEEVFRQLPIPAIEPFSEGVAEWDEDEPSPSPLVWFSEWLREKGRRRRVNPGGWRATKRTPHHP